MLARIIVGILLVVVSPIIACIACLVWIGDRKAIFFSQPRVGYRGRTFILYKFRTMRVGAERLQRQLFRKNESDGPTFKIRHDPRFTPVGAFLSHTGLDELPQLWNVVCGDMALIGPRPLPVSEAKKLKRWMHAREWIKPGIISPAILTGTYHNDFVRWMKSDIAYAKGKNIAGDIHILFRAAPVMWTLFLRALE